VSVDNFGCCIQLILRAVAAVVMRDSYVFMRLTGIAMQVTKMEPLRCSVWVRAVEASALGPHLPIDRMVANGVGAQALVKAAAAEGGGRRPAFTRAWAPMTIGRRGQWAALLSTPRTPVPPDSGGDRNNPLPTRCSEEPKWKINELGLADVTVQNLGVCTVLTYCHTDSTPRSRCRPGTACRHCRSARWSGRGSRRFAAHARSARTAWHGRGGVRP